MWSIRHEPTQNPVVRKIIIGIVSILNVNIGSPRIIVKIVGNGELSNILIPSNKLRTNAPIKFKYLSILVDNHSTSKTETL